ncbi:hypothetical protein BJ944DRAFT_260804 [Cunninghamella echinulata]|nr:hypothetical protein BJ944DRAFT_260804 [Cunninghamella echinulata]
MRNKSKANKTIDIRLDEEKFYFPGETIKGVVNVHPKSPTKTNHIIVRFIGEVFLSIKDKETITLFSKTKILPISTDSKSSHILDAKRHSFTFDFVVPDELPSTMEFGKRKASVKYTLVAIHDRPMVPESLCSKVVYTVPILEKIDVTCAQFIKPQEKSMDVLLPGGKYNQKCQTIVSIPRFGYTRGEIVPLKIIVNHFEPYTRQNALEVELVRIVEIRTQKNTSTTEDILKTVKQDINIIGPYNFSQSSTSQLMIPTSTPPTIRYKDKALHIHYTIRVRVRFGKAGKLTSNGTTTSTLEIPFVVGTWPRADIPIDDDDDELAGIFGETMLSDDEDEDEYDDDNTTDYEHKDMNNHYYNNNNYNFQQSRFSVISGTFSVPTLSIQQQQQQNNYNNNGNGNNNNNLVGRSDSTTSRVSAKSHGSQSSWRSSQSYETSNTFARHGTANNMSPLTNHQPHPYYNNNNNTNTNNNPATNIYYSSTMMNKSSSTPDLLAGLSPQLQHNPYQPQQQPPQPQYNGYIHQYQNTLPLVNEHDPRQSIYDDGNNNNRYYQSTHSSPSSYRQVSPQLQHQYQHNNIIDPTLMSSSSFIPYQHNRANSDEFRQNGNVPPPLPSPSRQQQTMLDRVPTRVLEPISPTSTSNTTTTNRFRTQQQQQSPRRNYDYSYCDGGSDIDDNILATSNGNRIINNNSSILDTISDDDDDDDEDDLFAIIEKKKKLAERDMRRKQGMVSTVVE